MKNLKSDFYIKNETNRCSENIIQEINNEKNYLKEYIDNNISIIIGKNISRELFREKYDTWCEKNGYLIDNSSNRFFSRRMSKLGIKNTSHNGKRVYKNIDFK